MNTWINTYIKKKLAIYHQYKTLFFLQQNHQLSEHKTTYTTSRNTATVNRIKAVLKVICSCVLKVIKGWQALCPACLPAQQWILCLCEVKQISRWQFLRILLSNFVVTWINVIFGRLFPLFFKCFLVVIVVTVVFSAGCGRGCGGGGVIKADISTPDAGD